MSWPPTGEPQDDTAPLARDNSRIARGQHPAAGHPTAQSGPNPAPQAYEHDPGGGARPAFAQQPPHPTGPGTRASAMPPHNQPPEPAHGPPFPQQEHVQQGFPQQEFSQQEFSQHGPDDHDRPPRRTTPLGWFGRGLALTAVAVVSGALWLAVKPGDQHDDAQNQGPATKNQFASVMTVNGDQGCAGVSEGKIKKFFAKHPCQHLTRALYTTNLPNGQKVLTSVNTVLMSDPNTAAQLNATATSDNTGNIKDLVDEHAPGTEHYPKLDDSGYASQPQGAMVSIGDSAYFGKNAGEKDSQLAEVTKDALNLAWKQNQAQ